MRHYLRVRLFLAAVAALALTWGAAVAATGGFSFTILTLRVSSRDPSRPLWLALLSAVAYALLSGPMRVRTDAESVVERMRSTAAIAAVALSFAVFIAGVRYGTFAAGGSDAYGYVSQAELWEQGNLHVRQPLASVLPWPDAIRTLGPLGYTAGTHGDDLVPIYSPGLPLLMAGFRKAFGSYGQYYVVPLLGALAVWLSFALGRWLTGSSSVGLSAAFVFAISPPFLASLMWPMSDVPVTAAWTLAFFLALRGSLTASAVSGLVASLAVLIRPNLAPVAGVIAISLLWRSLCDHGLSKRAARLPLAFVSGVLPGFIAVAALNANLYGSPLRSGYSSVHQIYTSAYLLINVPRYARWIVASGCAYVFVGVGTALLHWPRTVRVPHREPARFLVAGAVFVIWLSYMLWVPFLEQEWWFLRLLLPFWPISIVFAAALAAEVLARARLPAASAVLMGMAIVAGVAGYRATSASGVFTPRASEARYERAARYVSANTPQRTVILSMQHSGSVRYYAGRVTVRYDLLDPAWLDRGVTALSDLGYRTFILLDDWEEPQFRRRFGATNELGRLDWPGLTAAPGVRLYEAVNPRAASTRVKFP